MFAGTLIPYHSYDDTVLYIIPLTIYYVYEIPKYTLYNISFIALTLHYIVENCDITHYIISYTIILYHILLYCIISCVFHLSELMNARLSGPRQRFGLIARRLCKMHLRLAYTVYVRVDKQESA